MKNWGKVGQEDVLVARPAAWRTQELSDLLKITANSSGGVNSGLHSSSCSISHLLVIANETVVVGDGKDRVGTCRTLDGRGETLTLKPPPWRKHQRAPADTVIKHSIICIQAGFVSMATAELEHDELTRPRPSLVFVSVLFNFSSFSLPLP